MPCGETQLTAFSGAAFFSGFPLSLPLRAAFCAADLFKPPPPPARRRNTSDDAATGNEKRLPPLPSPVRAASFMKKEESEESGESDKENAHT